MKAFVVDVDICNGCYSCQIKDGKILRSVPSTSPGSMTF